MIKYKIKRIIGILFLFITIITTNIFSLNIDIASASEPKESKLIEKISKDYTNKFCNSIGFGLSKESAMNFSLIENKKVFEKKKDIRNIDPILIAEKISISVIEKCGYPINLTGESGINEFKTYYLQKYNDLKSAK